MKQIIRFELFVQITEFASLQSQNNLYLIEKARYTDAFAAFNRMPLFMQRFDF
jgi:hypothetical protein